MNRNPIGAHSPVSGGLVKALRYIDETDAEAVQVFIGNPRGWALSAGDRKADAAFTAGCAERGTLAYIHASLLVNLGSPTEATVVRSAQTLSHSVTRGAAIGALGVVFHAGSSVNEAHAAAAYRQLREALLPILDAAMALSGPRLLVEPTAGGGRCLASRVEHLTEYFAAVDNHPWLGVCLDTCHAWAAGHDLTAPGGMKSTLDTLVDACGGDGSRLRLIHANDSKDACGSVRDRHETIGAGSIGEAPFADLFSHAATDGVPMIVETPSAGSAGHAADIAKLKRLREI